MPAGYDIGLAASASATSGAANNSAFNVQGGGGSTGMGSARTNWIPWVIGGAIVLLALWLTFRRR